MTAPAFNPADLWEKLSASGAQPDEATTITKEHQRRLDFASHPDNQDAPGQIASALMGFGQGASFGWSDELAGILDPKMLAKLATGDFTGAKQRIAEAIDENRDYLAKARAEHGKTVNLSQLAGGGLSTALGGSIASPLLAGLTPGMAGATVGGAAGALSGAGMADRNKALGAAAGGITGAATGGVLGKFIGPTVSRITGNVLKLLVKRGGTQLPGLQTISDFVGREPAPTAAPTASTAELSPTDVEELHHMLNGEPTMAGFQTISRMTPESAGETPLTSKNQTLAPTNAEAANIQQGIREGVITKMQNAILHDEKLFPGKMKFDPKNMDIARKLAEKYVAQAGKQAEHEVNTPAVEKPNVNPFQPTPEEAAARVAGKSKKGVASEAARAAYTLTKAAGKSDEEAMEAAKRAAGYSSGSSGL